MKSNLSARLARQLELPLASPRACRIAPVAIALATLMLLVSLAAAPAASAQQSPPAEQEQAAPEKNGSKKEARKAAKEARIAEYLRKREQRRARREQRREDSQAAKEAAALQKLERAQAQAAQPGSPTTSTPTTKAQRQKSVAGSPLPRRLARAQDSVRRTQIGQDPTVSRYLDMVDRQEASPQQLGALGNFLARSGLLQEALEYYSVALRLSKDDPVLWINLGTLHRQLGQFGQATSAYSKALSIDNNNAVAHYNLGAVFDESGKYEEALQEYKLALTLDPTLGDPAVNPQAANNKSLMAVKLMLYREQAGSLGLPLLDVPGGALSSQQSKDSDQ